MFAAEAVLAIMMMMMMMMYAEVCEMLVDSSDDVGVTSRPCLSQFGDGRCDSDCDNERTQFDGFDCINSPAAAAATASGGSATTLLNTHTEFQNILTTATEMAWTIMQL